MVVIPVGNEKNGFPEEKLYKLLEERKKCSMDEIKNYLKEDYRIAIANLAKLGIHSQKERC